MQEAFKIFVLSTIVITFWTAFLLLQDRRGNKALNRWFALFLLALTAPQMDLYASHYVVGGAYQLALVASTFLWLKGPFVWTFMRVLTREEAGIKGTWWHFLPWCVVLVVSLGLPQYAMTCIFLGMGHMFCYLSLALLYLVKKRRYLADLWLGFQNTAYYWLLYVVGGLMVLGAFDLVVMSLVMSGRLSTYDLLDYFVFPIFSVYVFSIGILSVYRPELLFRSQPGDEIAALENPESDGQAIGRQMVELKERYLELDETLAQTLMQELTGLMQEQQVYRQNELSLPDLAVLLGISVHQISELLNVHGGLSFYDYVNGYRVKYACDLLADPYCQLRILDIAFEAGFNNKNSFYRSFRESLGVTPNQYRANALGAKSANILTSV